MASENLPLWTQCYHDDIKQYGPLPYSWSIISSANDTPQYLTHSGANFGADHPLSPAGRAKNPPIMPYPDNRDFWKGIPLPPLKGDLRIHKWTPFDGPIEAVHYALQQQIHSLSLNQVKEDRQYVQERNHITQILYHPADRDLIISPHEPELSAIARRNERNLIIFTPCIEAVEQWNNVWEPNPKTLILMRWSTGLQDDQIPIVLGWLPTYGEASSKLGRWYVIEPVDTAKEQWDTFWARSTWSTWFENSGFNKDLSYDDFAWIMVALQRSISLGLEVHDEHLGEWVYQYGQMLRANLKDGVKGTRTTRIAEKFTFDPQKQKGWKGPRLSYAKLSADIMMSKPDTAARKFAIQWDKDIVAMYKYKAERHMHCGEEDWEELVALLKDVSAMSI